ncbi:MAG: RtcB family protein [Armatimonadota bacterium]
MSWRDKIKKVSDYKWVLGKDYKQGMNVPAVVFADDKLMKQMEKEEAVQQLANVACMPGIVKQAVAMPDIHWGYGFPIGGVAAFDMDEGVISPGSVGFDINCGVRLIRSHLSYDDIKDKLDVLLNLLFSEIPSGVGKENRKIRLDSFDVLKQVLKYGSRWAVKNSYGAEEDIINTESFGCMEEADPDKVSSASYKRGINQLGTLGSGNHFLEIQIVDEIYDIGVADAFGLFKDQVVVLLHSGSRGLGHQVCTEYIEVMIRALNKYKIVVPDRQLACAPLKSREGQDYLGAMAGAANFAWANRQCMTHFIRAGFEKVFRSSARDLGMGLVYDVCHNIAKIETHIVEGKERVLCVHRKGATRAFGKGHKELPADYKDIGQPVLVPGDMGRYSYVCVAGEGAEELSFSSSCHGAGRVLSRKAAKKKIHGRDLEKDLNSKGILVRTDSYSGLAEEAPMAYKNVSDIVNVCEGAGIAKKVAKMRPLAVIKG